MLGPEDVGHRVVIRRIVEVRGNRPIYSDLLGELAAYDGSGLTVATPAGPVRVPHERVTAAKPIPHRRYGTAALERVAALAWPAPEIDRLGDWELRAAGGWTGRANSAMPIGDPGLDLPEAIDAVQRWYARRRLPARINVPLPLAAAVDRALDERGWGAAQRVLVQTARLADLTAGAGPADADGNLPRLDPRPTPEWLATAAGRKGELPDAGYRVLTGPSRVRFAAAYDGDTLVGCARGAVVSGFLHLGLVEVVASARRRGLAIRLVRALAGWALSEGAHSALLQVEEGNAPAVALYTRLGFTTHHTYRPRREPVARPPSPGQGR